MPIYFYLILESLINGNPQEAVNYLLDSDYDRPELFFEDLKEYYCDRPELYFEDVAKMASYLVCRYADLVRSEATCNFVK